MIKYKKSFGIIGLVFLTSALSACFFPKRNNRIIPVNYYDIVWVSTDGTLEFVYKSTDDEATVGTFKDQDTIYQIRMWWSSSTDYGIYINDDTLQYLSGDCIQLEEYKFKMTVEEDRIFGNRYESFIVVPRDGNPSYSLGMK